MTREERLRELYRRLRLARPAADACLALEPVASLLDSVEDQCSGIPRQTPATPPGESGGRMYPPQADSIRTLPDGRLVARTRGHLVIAHPDGALEIWKRKPAVRVLHKPGAAT